MGAAMFRNVYDDPARSEAYATLEFPGTYFLAFRDLPAIVRAHVAGGRALDFGCGAGRSTRFLRGLGFEVAGVDIAEPMLARARARDPEGDYRLLGEDGLRGLGGGAFDLVLSAFTFDNIPTRAQKAALFADLRALLRPAGRIVNLVSAPEIYVNEWASFSTRDFPANRAARCGDEVHIVMLDVPDRRPVVDVLWTDEGYRDVYAVAGLEKVASHRPLGRPDDGQAWVSEERIAPWVIDVLAPVTSRSSPRGTRSSRARR
jgi:SAM-dependent methyltransferase